jgi:hypothetical protein
MRKAKFQALEKITMLKCACFLWHNEKQNAAEDFVANDVLRQDVRLRRFECDVVYHSELAISRRG